MDSIKQWFQSLESNEQKMVIAAAVFFAIVILFFGILKPINNSVEQLQKQVKTKQKNVNWMKAQLPLIRSSGSSTSSSNANVPLSRVVTQSTSQFGLSVSRVQEKSDSEMQVWIENAAFDNFLRWTDSVEKRYSVEIFDVNIRGRERDGISSINLKLIKK